MKRVIITPIVIAGIVLLSAVASAAERPTYVGQGRYACSDGARNCAAVDRHNQAVESNRRAERESREARAERKSDESRERMDKFKDSVRTRR